MKKRILLSISTLFLFTLPACAPVEIVEPTPTRRALSPEEDYAAEELAAEIIATASAEKTQAASTILPYVEISDEERTYLAFWFTWNDETVFLPITESTMTDSGLISCQLDSGKELAIGKLFSGSKIEESGCVTDETAQQNAPPIIRIPRYFDGGIKLEGSNDAESKDWNIIDLNGDYAENFADIVTFVIENDLLGSSDLTLSLHKLDNPNSELFDAAHVIPSYSLPAEALQISFSSDQLENFEYVDDVVYALERQFTWKIPAGFEILNLSPGDENWFALKIEEGGGMSGEAYIQIKGVETSDTQ